MPPHPNRTRAAGNHGNGAAASAGRSCGEDPRLTAPGVLDPPRPPTPVDATYDDDNDSMSDGDNTWARVVRKGNARRKKAPTAAPARVVPPGDAEGDSPEPPSDLEPSDIPPPRILEIPAAPRRTIIQKHQAQLRRVDRLRENGASANKLQRAYEASKRLEREVRLAGGSTDKALSFAIKAEDVSIEKARRSLQRAREAKEERVRHKETIEKELLRDDIRIARYEQRYRAAIDRRFSLATNKWSEAAPSDTVEEFRSAVNQLASADPSLANVRALLQRFLDHMSPPPLDADLAADDTPTDTDPEADGDSDSCDDDGDGRPRPHGTEGHAPTGGLATCSQGGGGGLSGYQAQLQAARALYEKVSAERLAAIEGAEAQASRSAAKRALGADGRKSQELDGDTDMVEVLSVDEINRVFSSRLEALKEDIAHLTDMAEKEEIPVPLPPRTAARRRSRPPTPQRADPAPAARDPSPRPVPVASLELAQSADLIPQHERAADTDRRRQEALDDHVAFQERLQAQQELETQAAIAREQKFMAKKAAAAAAARVLEGILAARQRAERAPTPVVDRSSCTTLSRWRGPTGTQLGDHPQQQVRGARPGRSPGRRLGDEAVGDPRGRRDEDGNGAPCRERSPRLRQSDMAV